MNDGLALLERGGDGLTRATLKNIFDVFDKDKDGFVSAEEFKAVLDDQGESMSENEVAGLVSQVDAQWT